MNRGEAAADNRQRLVLAAADLISANGPGAEVPLRTICDRVGVKLPTLYHYFGSKEGLIDAVVSHGFSEYLSRKHSGESSGDPIQDLRHGWDEHVRFGLEHPAFYVLMYGRTEPGHRSGAAQEPYVLLLNLVNLAAAQGRIRVGTHLAADHILAANIGVTLYLISEEEPDLSLSGQVRDATFAAISTDSVDTPARKPAATNQIAHAARALRAALELSDEALVLSAAERTLLVQWLGKLGESH